MQVTENKIEMSGGSVSFSVLCDCANIRNCCFKLGMCVTFSSTWQSRKSDDIQSWVAHSCVGSREQEQWETGFLLAATWNWWMEHIMNATFYQSSSSIYTESVRSIAGEVLAERAYCCRGMCKSQSVRSLEGFLREPACSWGTGG